jgi:hypothetical protein
MKRIALALVLIPIVSLAGCAHAVSLQTPRTVSQQKTIDLGGGIAVDSGPVLTALPPDQRYRFVLPEELAKGVGSLEESSFQEPPLAQWRKEFASIVGNGRWVQSADSAQFDVTVFRTGRMVTQRVDRPQLAASAPSNCQYALQPVPCMDDPTLFTEESRVDYRAFYIIRRRADGAVRVWNSPWRATADVQNMLRAGAAIH